MIVGMRPEHFEDAKLVSQEQRGGATLTATIDVLESWVPSSTPISKSTPSACRRASSKSYLERATFVTGEILHIDGGQAAGH